MRGHAAVTRAPHQLAWIEELDLDEPRDDEILVRVVATGIRPYWINSSLRATSVLRWRVREQRRRSFLPASWWTWKT